jgi:hypothetical protein
MGNPSNSRNAIKFLIQIGFLLIDQQKGVKFNKDFKPRK